jgi:hypothetical protein
MSSRTEAAVNFGGFSEDFFGHALAIIGIKRKKFGWQKNM